jgi:hypothetical protein
MIEFLFVEWVLKASHSALVPKLAEMRLSHVELSFKAHEEISF